MTAVNSREKAILVARLCLDKKANDVVILKMDEVSSFTDYFVICGGGSTTQVKAVGEYIEETLENGQYEGATFKKQKPAGKEGVSAGRWVLLDYGDVIVHVFEQDTREFYNIEKLWLDAPRIEVEDTPR